MPLADHCGGVDGLERLLDQGCVEIVHLGYLRGRDIKNSIIICSEAENLTKSHIQLLIGRVGEGSNLWLDGDLKQRDKAVFEKSAGLETMIDRLKGNKLFGYVKLVKTERSETARLADLLDD
jgi:PhoH-like ATPase